MPARVRAPWDPPGYLTETLGLVPADPLRRREWARSAGRIEQHRAVYDITDLHHALGMEPAWNDASHRAIEHFRLVRTVAADRTPSFSRGVEPLQGPVLEL